MAVHLLVHNRTTSLGRTESFIMHGIVIVVVGVGVVVVGVEVVGVEVVGVEVVGDSYGAIGKVEDGWKVITVN